MYAPFLFLSKFFTQPLFNASIWPTDDKVAQEICKSVNWKDKKVILELGPGTGPITKHILNYMDKDAVYYGIEYDSDYLSILRKEHHGDNIHFVQGNVRDIEHIVAKLIGAGNIDVIISTLPYKPFVDYPHALDRIKNCANRGTQFRGISYSPFIFKKVYKRLNPKVVFFSWKNIPPIYIIGVH
ncbi:MAG: rRNA adenine N-6-methyltransferase family protein [Candidatus Absconditabacterales bacterium]